MPIADIEYSESEFSVKLISHCGGGIEGFCDAKYVLSLCVLVFIVIRSTDAWVQVCLCNMQSECTEKIAEDVCPPSIDDLIKQYTGIRK